MLATQCNEQPAIDQHTNPYNNKHTHKDEETMFYVAEKACLLP